ncbi:MAG TPA: hypothetical protein EYH34_10040, partial [Planctomycetes bacterium]|nr:hypothetical protein [Planctomycetota bacterium]
MSSRLRSVLLAAVVACVLGQQARGQPQVTIQTPHPALSESFFENMGVSWGLSGRNWNLRVFGSPLQAAPPFGGFDPGAGLSSGMFFRRNGLSGFFNWNLSQGVRRSFVTQTPVLTLQNGLPGAVYDT